MIVLKNITKKYKVGSEEVSILKQINLNIAQGEMTAIKGASGSGKSTLMNLIGLLDKADEGEYALNGQVMRHTSEDEQAKLRNQYIGFVFQQFHLLPRLTAAQNIALPLVYRGLPQKKIKESVEEQLEQVGLLKYSGYFPPQLSGGQQQRIAIARALVGNPPLLLADEPTGALDSKTGKEIMDIFIKINQEGRTILLITHDEKIAALCQREIELVDGKII